MRILAMDSSFDPCGMALCDEGGIVAAVSFRHERDLSRWWAPRLQWMLAEVGWEIAQIEGLAVCHGPGSFTGLRIGVAAMKTLAQALSCPILGIDSLELVALPYRSMWPGSVVSALYCRKGEVYRSAYRETETLMEPAVRTIEELNAEMASLPGPILLAGHTGPNEGMQLPEGGRWGDAWLGIPHVERLALEGRRRLVAGEGVDPMALSVLYLKRSQAEEQLEAKQRGESLPASSYVTPKGP